LGQTAILLRRAALQAAVGIDPTIGGPTWVAIQAGPFLADGSHIALRAYKRVGNGVLQPVPAQDAVPTGCRRW
jgi:hypothetical protein